MLDAGQSNDHLRPLLHDGNAYEGAKGSHRGNAEDLNVSNPQPGMLYYWARNTRSDLMRFMRMGYEVVPPDAPERKFNRDPNFRELGLDGIQTNKDVVLLRIPEQRYRALQERRAHARKLAIEGPTQEFLAKNQDAAYARFEGSAEGPILYKARGHAVLDYE